MPRYQINWKADITNITNLSPLSVDDYEWIFKFTCTKCHELHDVPVTLKANEVVEMNNSRGTANLIMKCNFCKSEGSVDLEMNTLKPYTIENSGKMQPLIVIEGRGWEPVEWIPTIGFRAEGVESGTVFDEIDLTDLEWCDYDEKAGESVDIMDIQSEVKKAKK
ncbi:UPF0587 protein C1orf123 [Globomyces pollinis-pini]|nr:UPF0587 protein C1orf123 [Globomyces pollinis-pini]